MPTIWRYERYKNDLPGSFRQLVEWLRSLSRLPISACSSVTLVGDLVPMPIHGWSERTWRMVPSGYVKIAIENGHWNSGFSHKKWWFSIATLNYQRVVVPMLSMFIRVSLVQKKSYESLKKSKPGFGPVTGVPWYTLDHHWTNHRRKKKNIIGGPTHPKNRAGWSLRIIKDHR